MLTRRSIISFAAVGAMLLAAPTLALAQDSSAAAFVQQTGDKILILAPTAQNDPSARAQLLDLVGQALDTDGIARFALGPYSRRATPDQLSRYLQVFHQIISSGVTTRLGTYADAKLTLGKSVPQGAETLVNSTVSRPGAPDANIGWLVGTIGGQTKIVDVIAEGTSMRLTERSDFTGFLQSHSGNIDALLAALQAQMARGAAPSQ